MSNLSDTMKVLVGFLGSAKGKRARPSTDEVGLDAFSPIAGTAGEASIQLIGKGETIKGFAPRIHMLSVKREKENGQSFGGNTTDRLKVIDLKPVGPNDGGAWWSVPMLQFNSTEERDSAAAALIEQDDHVKPDIITPDQVREACKSLGANPVAANVIKVLDSMELAHEGEGRALDHQILNNPLRFNLKTSFFLVMPSSAPNNELGYYTNRGRQRNRQQGGARTVSQQGNTMSEDGI